MKTITWFIFLWLASSAGVSAQDTNKKNQEEPKKYRTELEPVTVTARRYEEDLQKTPISIIVIDSKDIETRGLKTLSDLEGVAPNVGFDSTAPLSGSSNAASVFIRGIGQTDFIPTTDPGVGTYVDGVYLARALGANMDLLDIERIEVLRGPQGTLFGKNTIGGAINVITKKPSDRFGGSLKIGAGNYDQGDVRLALDVPIEKDVLLSKWSILRKTTDGTGDRLIADDTMGDVNSEAFRGSFAWFPSKDWDVTLTIDWSQARETMPTASLATGSPAEFDAGVSNSALSALYNALIAPTKNIPGYGTGVLYDHRWLTNDPLKSNATGPNDSDLNEWGMALTIYDNAKPVEIVSITAFRAMDDAFGRDADHSPLLIAHSENHMEQSQFSQEFRVRGHAFENSLDWLGGVYYFQEEAQDTLNVQAVPDLYSVIPVDTHLVGPTESHNTSRAVFAHGTYHITKQLDLFGGARYTTDRKEFNSEVILSRTDVYVIDPGWHTETFHDVSPRAGIGYQWTDDLYSYASVSQGFKSGGFVARYFTRRDEGPASFDPEKVTTYEVGAKSEWLDKRLRINTAMFYSDYTDIQVIVFEGVAPITKNAAHGRVRGLELDLTAVPADGLRIGSGLGLLDAEYTEVDDNSGVDRDDKFVNTPDWSWTNWIEYRFPLADYGELALHGDYSWRDDVANDAPNTPELIQDPVGLLNARVTYVPKGSEAKFSLFVKNLTDERVIISGAADKPSFGIVDAVYAPPRFWGLSFDLAF